MRISPPLRAAAASGLAAVTLAALSACSAKSDAPGQPAVTPRNVTLTSAQLQHIRIVPVTEADFRKTLEVPGVVDFDNDQSTSVTAPTIVTPVVTLSTTSRIDDTTSRTSMIDTFGIARTTSRCSAPRAAPSSFVCRNATNVCGSRSTAGPGRSTNTNPPLAGSSHSTDRTLVTRARIDCPATSKRTRSPSARCARSNVSCSTETSVSTPSGSVGVASGADQNVPAATRSLASSPVRNVRPNSRARCPSSRTSSIVARWRFAPATPVTRARMSGTTRAW